MIFRCFLIVGQITHVSLSRSRSMSRRRYATSLLPAGLELLVISGRLADPLRNVPGSHANAAFGGVGPLRGGLLSDWFAYGVHRYGAVTMFSKPVLNSHGGSSRQRTRAARFRLLHYQAWRFFRYRTPDQGQYGNHDYS